MLKIPNFWISSPSKGHAKLALILSLLLTIKIFISFLKQLLQLIDCNGTRTRNHLDRKRTLNHLVKLVK